MKDLLFRIFRNKAYWMDRAETLRSESKRWWVEGICHNELYIVRSRFKVLETFSSSKIKDAVLLAESLNRF